MSSGWVNTSTISILKKVYPIGCIYTSTNSTNPATSLGFGTWSAFGAGRVPVGFDSGQTEFDTDEETGGAKTVTLAETNLPSHKHFVMASASVTATALTSSNQLASARGSAGSYDYGADNGGTSTAATIGLSSATGSGTAVTTLPPYIVVRMWKRTA